jgi:hypothetical protein
VTFFTPLFLLAAAALAIPLLLHLFRRREGRIQSFPALRYLQRSTRERARTVRLRQLLLMALRLAILALLVLTGARLVLPLAGGDQPPAGIAIVVDNGISSSTVVDDRRVLDHLVEMAVDALARAGSDDRIWILPAGEPWRPAFPRSPAEAQRELRGLEPSGATGDIPRSVARARSLLEAGAPPLQEILVVSTLSPASFPPGSPAGAHAGPTVRVGSPELTLPPNRGIREVTIGGGLPPRARTPSQLAVRLGGDPVADQAIRVILDETLATAGRTGPEGELVLELPPLDEGWVQGRVELDPDALRADDVHYFALPIRPPPRVATPAQPPAFLETALQVLADRERILRTPPTDNPSVLIESGDGAGSLPTLFFAPGDAARLPAANRRLESLGSAWRLEMAPGASTAPRTLAAEAPLLRLPATLQVRESYRLVPVEGRDDGQVMAELSDGTPWIGYTPRDPGQEEEAPVLLIASPPDTTATGLPTSAAMLPFLASAIELLDGGAGTVAAWAGRPLPLPEGAASVISPSGTATSVPGMSTFAETGQIGVYQILDPDDELLAAVAVNPSTPAEVERLTVEEAAHRLGPDAVGLDTREWARLAPGERRGREIWQPLLLAVLLLLLAEGWVAARREPARATPSNNPLDQTS